MFGGHGIYSGDTFFAIWMDGRLHFKVDDETRADYEEAGMRPFDPPKGPTIRSYYEVPDDVQASPDELVEWAATAVSVASGGN